MITFSAIRKRFNYERIIAFILLHIKSTILLIGFSIFLLFLFFLLLFGCSFASFSWFAFGDFDFRSFFFTFNGHFFDEFRVNNPIRHFFSFYSLKMILLNTNAPYSQI